MEHLKNLHVNIIIVPMLHAKDIDNLSGRCISTVGEDQEVRKEFIHLYYDSHAASKNLLGTEILAAHIKN